jgi:hypothetical protein
MEEICTDTISFLQLGEGDIPIHMKAGPGCTDSLGPSLIADLIIDLLKFSDPCVSIVTSEFKLSFSTKFSIWFHLRFFGFFVCFLVST